MIRVNLVILVIVVLLYVEQGAASNYFAYVHGKEPSKASSGRPLTVFKAKLVRLCALYARGQRAQERLMGLDGNGPTVGRRMDDAPQICRPVLTKMANAPVRTN